MGNSGLLRSAECGKLEEVTYLGLGSNMGDRLAHLRNAIEGLKRLPGTRVRQESAVYRSAAWGKTAQDDFLNMAVEVCTSLSPRDLLAACKRLERKEGRIPTERWGPRPLDIDILLFGDLALSTPELTIPHPFMWERHFVLRPLADLAPDLASPGNITITDRLKDTDITAQTVVFYTVIRNANHDATESR